jgi:PAS domain S-box-containing protein
MGALYSQRVKARTLGYLIISFGAISCVIVAVPNADSVRETPVLVLAPVGLALGLAVLVAGSRASATILHVGLAAGTILVAATNHFVGPGVLFPIVYTWMALYAFAFFRRAEAMAHMALIGLSYVLVLTGQEVASPVVRWLLGIGTPLVAGLLVSEVVRLAAARAEILQDRETRIRAIIESAPDAFLTIDDQSTVLVWNREAERMFGYTAQDAIGRHLADLILDPDQKPAHHQRRDEALADSPDQPPRRYEREMGRRDGSRFPAEVTLQRVDGDDRPFLLVFIRDVTEREERERDREQLYREQSARQEAERMAAMVNGLQLLLDAALSHGRLEEMMAALVPRLCEVLGADIASIFLVEEATGQLVLRASSAGLPEEPVVSVLESHISAQVRESRSPLLINDPPPDKLADPAMRGASSVIAVPLMAGVDATGVIVVGVAAPRRFDHDNLLLLGLAADRVALAVDHAMVFEREHRIAETLQRSLLPERLPKLPGLEVSARYIPAASEAEVGGDWYDVIPLDSSRVGLVMGDVAGKGLLAASMVGRLRSAMRAYATEGHEPAEVVARLNELVWSEVGDSEMVTLVYLVIDPAAEEVRWVNAGHPPPLVLGDEQPWFLEGGRGVPLGVMPFVSYEEAIAPMPGGHALLLYTDGLVERPGELLDDGFERLARAVADSECGADALCDQVLRRLVPDGAMADDVALLSLFAPELSDRFSLELASEPGQLASMRALLRRWLHHAGVDAADISEVLIATGEAAANAIEHAHAGREEFEICAVIGGGGVDITVRDHGRWREKPTEGHGREEPTEGRGRGLVLIRELMDQVEVTPSDAGTTVHMRRHLRMLARDPAS